MHCLKLAERLLNCKTENHSHQENEVVGKLQGNNKVFLKIYNSPWFVDDPCFSSKS